MLHVLWFHRLQPSHWRASCRGLTFCLQTMQLSVEDMTKNDEERIEDGNRVVFESESEII